MNLGEELHGATLWEICGLRNVPAGEGALRFLYSMTHRSIVNRDMAACLVSRSWNFDVTVGFWVERVVSTILKCVLRTETAYFGVCLCPISISTTQTDMSSRMREKLKETEEARRRVGLCQKQVCNPSLWKFFWGQQFQPGIVFRPKMLRLRTV